MKNIFEAQHLRRRWNIVKMCIGLLDVIQKYRGSFRKWYVSYVMISIILKLYSLYLNVWWMIGYYLYRITQMIKRISKMCLYKAITILKCLCIKYYTKPCSYFQWVTFFIFVSLMQIDESLQHWHLTISCTYYWTEDFIITQIFHWMIF